LRELSGFTLVELVIAIVALAALGAALSSVFVQSAASSADPQIRAQARVIAEGYVEEIMLKRYCENPDDDCSNETGSDEGEKSRATYNDVCDYNAIGTENPRDQNDDQVAGGDLSDYDVTVSVGDGTDDCAHEDGPQRIKVTVSHTSGLVNYELVSQRADF